MWVPQLAGDTAFTGWLDAQGLTLAEAARIQLPYDNNDTAPYLVASMAALAVTVPTTVYNATANRDGKTDFVNFVGVLSGLSAIGLAVAGTSQDAPFVLAAANLGAGVTAMFTSLVSHRRYVRTAKERREAERERAATTMRRIETTVSPTLSLAGDRSAGIALTVRF